MSKKILNFYQFINESYKGDFELDERFTWYEEIKDLCDQIIRKRDYLVDNFDYNRHKEEGFEFDIKQRGFPSVSPGFNYTEDEISDLWQDFLDVNLQSYGDDIVEESPYFEDWFTAGRSGGWLILKHKSNLINDTETVIEDTVNYLNNLTDEIGDEEYQELKKIYLNDDFKNIKGVLKRFDVVPEYLQNFHYAEKESESVIKSLKEFLKELENLEDALDGVKNRINNFWKNSETYFEDYLESESKWRDSNQ